MGLSFHTYSSLLSLVLILTLMVTLMVSHVRGDGVRNRTKSQTNGCNFYQGSWLYDESYHLYDSSQCAFIEKQFDCLHNGRSDKQYLKYKWKPSACELPRFDGQNFLKIFQGKTIMFVGDSLSLNQWQSLACMLHVAVPNAKYTLYRIGDISTFTFSDYNVKVKLFRKAFLIDIVTKNIGQVLNLDSIESGKVWLTADILIFNSWHWWLHTGRKQPWQFIQAGNKIYKDMDRLVAYEKGLTTWAKWVDSNINPTTTRVIFQGVSPDHNMAMEWNDPHATALNCSGQGVPLTGSAYPGGPHPAEIVVERVLKKMAKAVYLLDVTTLSQLRIDGHPSVYGHGGHRDMDCSHWCLAGVPDTWNQLLHASLLMD